MGVGPHDANAIFPYKGVWHAMHQANWTDWAHLTSPTTSCTGRWWTPSALAPNGDWDATLDARRQADHLLRLQQVEEQSTSCVARPSSKMRDEATMNAADIVISLHGRT